MLHGAAFRTFAPHVKKKGKTACGFLFSAGCLFLKTQVLFKTGIREGETASKGVFAGKHAYDFGKDQHVLPGRCRSFIREMQTFSQKGRILFSGRVRPSGGKGASFLKKGNTNETNTFSESKKTIGLPLRKHPIKIDILPAYPAEKTILSHHKREYPFNYRIRRSFANKITTRFFAWG